MSSVRLTFPVPDTMHQSVSWRPDLGREQMYFDAFIGVTVWSDVILKVQKSPFILGVLIPSSAAGS